MLLDEPTNDLDVETLRALEEALLSFPGCAVVISHDRWFLDRIATHILAFEGNSEVVWFEGNYAEYVEDFKRRKGRGRGYAAPHPLQEAGGLNGLALRALRLGGQALRWLRGCSAWNSGSAGIGGRGARVLAQAPLAIRWSSR